MPCEYTNIMSQFKKKINWKKVNDVLLFNPFLNEHMKPWYKSIYLCLRISWIEYYLEPQKSQGCIKAFTWIWRVYQSIPSVEGDSYSGIINNNQIYWLNMPVTVILTFKGLYYTEAFHLPSLRD